MNAERTTDYRFYSELGRNIRLARQAAGRSQKDVARRLDVTFQQVQKYEQGSNRIPVDRLIALSKYLDVQLCCFFDFMELQPDHELHDLVQTVTDREFRCLLRAWSVIKDRNRRDLLLGLVKLVGDARLGTQNPGK